MSNKIDKIILYLLIFFVVYCSFNIGLHWDQLNIIQFGQDRLNYIFSLGSNKDYLEQWNSRFYPGAYSTIAVFITKFFPIKYELESLRFVNILFGVSAIFGITAISKELFNKKVSKFVFIISFLNPHFFNHIIMNERDLIIAFCNIWATYLIIKYLKNQSIDKKRKKYTLIAGLVIGLGLGVRVVFLGTLVPLILFSLLDIFYFKKVVCKNFSLKFLSFDLVKIILVAYFIMISFWPHTHENIFILPFKLVLESFSTSQLGVPLGLLNGDFYFTKDTPKSYILTSLVYKLPEYILFCYLIFPFLFLLNINTLKNKFSSFYYKIILIILIIIFPNLVLYFNSYSIYDGLRHFLYIIPYLSIIPALIIYYLFYLSSDKITRFLKILIIPMFIFFLYNFFSFTPFHYTYLNSLNGKLANANIKFENDYWGISIKNLISQMSKNKELSKKREINLASCGVSEGTIKYYLKSIKNIKFNLVRPEQNYDYIMMTNRVVWSFEGMENLNLAKTCYQTYQGENILTVTKKGLLLSVLRKKTF